MKKYVRSWDEFGHPIELNFNKDGSRYNTVYGGCNTILLKVSMLLFAIRSIIQLKDHSNDSY